MRAEFLACPVAPIFVNDEQVARGGFEKTLAGRLGGDTFGIGEDSSQPITFDYTPPFTFTGTIGQVSIELQ